MESVKPRFAVERHLRELFATEGQEEPEPAADAEPSLLTSEAGTSPLEAIHEETTPLSEALAPPIPVCESTVAAPVPLPVSLEDTTRQDWARTNEQRHDWTPRWESRTVGSSGEPTDAWPTSWSVPPIRTPRSCPPKGRDVIWATTPTTWWMVARRGSSWPCW